MAAVLHAERLARQYGDIKAISGFSLAIGPGEAIALIGPNGAGKTTALRLLAGPEEPDAGRVTRPARGVGWAPQRPAVYPRLTTRENLAFFCALEGPDATDERVAELLARADLQEYADKRTDALSTGTVQRLNLAIAICGAPAVLLLDEPTATLSPDQRLRLWEWIESMRAQDGLAVVFSTQSVDEARDHGDRLVVIAAGAQVFDGTYDGLAAEGAGDAERGFLRLIESA